MRKTVNVAALADMATKKVGQQRPRNKEHSKLVLENGKTVV